MIDSTENGVVYKSLSFMEFPDYRVGDDGSVWSRKNNKWNGEDALSAKDTEEIKRLRNEEGWSFQRIADKHGVCRATINRAMAREHGEWKRLKPHTDANGDRTSVTLSSGKGFPQKRFSIAFLVLSAFRGPRPEGYEACHFPDRDRSNNRYSNLRWDTHAGNEQDKKVHGTEQSGERNHLAKLNDDKVREMRKLYDEMGHTTKTVLFLAAKFNVFWTNVYAIVKRKTWKHVL
jgi:HNH endonuclease